MKTRSSKLCILKLRLKIRILSICWVKRLLVCKLKEMMPWRTILPQWSKLKMMQNQSLMIFILLSRTRTIKLKYWLLKSTLKMERSLIFLRKSAGSENSIGKNSKSLSLPMRLNKTTWIKKFQIWNKKSLG